MRVGFSCKRAGEILNVHPQRVTQKLDAAMDTVTRLWEADSTAFMELLISEVAKRRQRYGYAMPDEEIETRILELKGRADRPNGRQPREPDGLVPAEPVGTRA